jgi:ribose transport system permease protein
MKKELGISVLLIVVCAVTAIMNPNFLSAFNLSNQANTIGIYGIFSIGLGLVIITGGIDLSVGSLIALAGMLLVMAIKDWHWAWPLAALLAIAIPMVLGWVHGMLITTFNIQPFIVTLCGLLIYRGVTRFISHDGTKGFGDAAGLERFQDLTTGAVFGVPMPFVVLVVVAAIMWIVLHHSVFGRYLFALGRNEEAARFSGINTKRVIVSSYILMGLLTGISAILLASYTNLIAPSTHGIYFELYGIAAAVVGGCSLRGGEGSILGILIGTALLQVLQNLVNLLGIDSSLNFAVMGSVVLVGVLADQIFQKRAKKKLARQQK